MKFEFNQSSWKKYFLGVYLDRYLNARMGDALFRNLHDYEHINMEVFTTIGIIRSEV